MFKLNVPARVKAERINICSQCKYFKEETTSCGTLMNLKNFVNGTHGGLVDPSEVPDDTVNHVTYYKKKVRLCGCDMMDAAKFSLKSCPLGKWGRYRLNDADTELLMTFVRSLPTTGKLSSAQVDDVVRWFEKMSGRPMKRCDNCIRQIIKELQLQTGQATWVQI